MARIKNSHAETAKTSVDVAIEERRSPNSEKDVIGMIDATPEFEVFNDLGEDAEPKLIASVSALENAKTIMQQAATHVPGCYFVWDASEGEVVARLMAV